MFVGGGYAGVEAIAELQDMARYATRYYEGVAPDDMRWVLVEAATRIMPEVSVGLALYTVERLVERGIDVRLDTRLDSFVDGHVMLCDGEEFDAETLVWTAGVKANPMLAATDLPRDDKGRVRATPIYRARRRGCLLGRRQRGRSRPDQEGDPNALTGPSAQHAVRQAKVLARNVAAFLTGKAFKDYKHAYAGSVASLGLYRGVAEIYGIKLRGILAWFMHRTYHMSRMPTLNRKIRVLPTGPSRCSSGARSFRWASCSSRVPNSRRPRASARCLRCPDELIFGPPILALPPWPNWQRQTP